MPPRPSKRRAAFLISEVTLIFFAVNALRAYFMEERSLPWEGDADDVVGRIITA